MTYPYQAYLTLPITEQITHDNLTLIQTILERNQFDMHDSDIHWGLDGINDDFKAIWIQVSQAVPQVKLLVFLVYDAGHKLDVMSLLNGQVKGIDRKDFHYQVTGVTFEINLFQGLELTNQVNNQLQQIGSAHSNRLTHSSRPTQSTQLPKGTYKVTTADRFSDHPNLTLTRSWQHGFTGLYTYTGDGTSIIAELEQGPQITGRPYQFPSIISFNELLTSYSWKIYQNFHGIISMDRNEPDYYVA